MAKKQLKTSLSKNKAVRKPPQSRGTRSSGPGMPRTGDASRKSKREPQAKQDRNISLRKRPPGTEEKESILHAALTVLRESGANGFTLQHVAREAGLPLSGIRKHYRDRDDLVSGIIDNHMRLTEDRMQKQLGESPHPREALRFLVDDTFGNYYEEDTLDEIAPLIFAVAAENPGMLSPFESLGSEIEYQINGLRDRELAYIIHLALDGLQFWRLLGAALLPAHRHEAVRKKLLSMIETL